MENVYKKLIEVFEILSLNPNLSFIKDGVVEIQTSSGNSLCKITSQNIELPDKDFEKNAWITKSPLNNEFVNLKSLENFIQKLTDTKSIVRLNHLGFCYKVDNQIEEKNRLAKIIANTNLKLYEEKSNDVGLWLFVGNTKVWGDPLIEFLPVEHTKDEYVNFWLPHIQIDIDTTLTSNKIAEFAIETFSNYPPVFPVTIIEGVIYTMRIRLGIVEGINIDLDLATNNRKVKFHRQKILDKV